MSVTGVEAQQSHNANAYVQLGERIVGDRGKQFALPCFRKAAEAAPRDVKIQIRYAELLNDCRQPEMAETVLAAAFEISPDNERLFYRIGLQFLVQNHLEQLAQFLKTHHDRLTKTYRYRILVGLLHWRQGNHDSAFHQLQHALSLTNDPDCRASTYYNLAKIADEQHRFDDAMAFMTRAGDLRQSLYAESQGENRYLKTVGEYVSWFGSSSQKLTSATPETSTRDPIFVTGFPRSGNTLMGRILNSHPKCNAASEQESLAVVSKELNFRGHRLPDCINDLDQNTILRLRQKYDDVMTNNHGVCNVDVMPLNLVKLPLIWKLFPNARVVVSIRNPMDACLSCFAQNFADNSAMRNFHSMESTVHLYCRVFELFRMYCDADESRLHIVKYEDVVNDFRSSMTDVLSFLELSWTEHLQSFNSSSSGSYTVQTPSYHQVVRPLYQTSQDRWQHYRRYLSPFISQLAPWFDYFGYDLPVKYQRAG